MNNSYGRCGTFTNGALPPRAYTATGSKTLAEWPASGLPGEGSYTVKTNLPASCIAASAQKTCTPNPLIVNGPTSCKGEANLSTYCPGIDWDDVKWNVDPTTGSTPGCYYVQDITNINSGGNYKVNGTTYSGYKAKSDLGATADGGYYIHALSNTNWHGSSVTAGTTLPPCVSGDIQLICGSLNAISGVAGVAITARPALTCNDGSTVGTPTWGTTNAPNWNNPVAGKYKGFTVTANCGTKTGRQATCNDGEINVFSSTPTQLNFTNCNAQTVAPGYYRINSMTGEHCNGNFRCKQTASTGSTYTIGKFDNTTDITVGAHAGSGNNLATTSSAIGKNFVIYTDKGGASGDIQCGFQY